MKTIDVALLLYDILNEVIADDDKTRENLEFYREKLKGLIDERIKTDESI